MPVKRALPVAARAVRPLWWIAVFLGILVISVITYLISVRVARNLAPASTIPPTTPVVVVREVASAPPVLPRENPQYPMRNTKTDYQQMGILTGPPAEEGKDPTVLPLFGRPIPHRNERWEYYSSTDKNHLWRIPVVFEGRNCQEEIGCREIQAGDKVTVPVYKNELSAQVYKYQ